MAKKRLLLFALMDVKLYKIQVETNNYLYLCGE